MGERRVAASKACCICRAPKIECHGRACASNAMTFAAGFYTILLCTKLRAFFSQKFL